jgi:hypothetical protein
MTKNEKQWIYFSSYKDFNEFRLWCLINKPSFLYKFINPFMCEIEWQQQKENMYETEHQKIEDEHVYSSSVGMLKRYYAKNKLNNEGVNFAQLVNQHNMDYKLISNKKSWIETKRIPIACFDKKSLFFLKSKCDLLSIKKEINTNFKPCNKWFVNLYYKVQSFFI